MSAEGLSRDEILRYFQVRAPRLRRKGRDELRGPCPIHKGKRDSFAVEIETGKWYCHSECSRGGGVFDFEATMSGTSAKEARAEVSRLVGRTAVSKERRRQVALYSYKDEDGKLLYQCVRYSPKGFSQRRPAEGGSWIWNLSGVRLVLYRLPDILHAQTVFVVEGEKDADSLSSLGLAATCNPMGAGKWRTQYAAVLRQKAVIIIADADAAGNSMRRRYQNRSRA